MKSLADRSEFETEEMILTPQSETMPALPGVLAPAATELLDCMFRDPRMLDEHQRGDLIAHLRSAVELAPQVPEVRVLLGMALSVDLQAQDAMEQLRESVRQDPDCYIAQLKFGELLMRLRICDQALEHTEAAARLASNRVQSEMARKQATVIRTMLREGVERGGYKSVFGRLFSFRRKSTQPTTAPVLVGSK